MAKWCVIIDGWFWYSTIAQKPYFILYRVPVAGFLASNLIAVATVWTSELVFGTCFPPDICRERTGCEWYLKYVRSVQLCMWLRIERVGGTGGDWDRHSTFGGLVIWKQYDDDDDDDFMWGLHCDMYGLQPQNVIFVSPFQIACSSLLSLHMLANAPNLLYVAWNNL